MMKIDEKSRLTFLKYAVPCAGTLVKRGTITQDHMDSLREAVKSGQAPKGAERIFKVALSACSLLAIDMGKGVIDDEVLYNYYLFGHDDIIDKRFDEMGDFDAEACRIRAGIVEDVFPGSAVVSNSLGRKEYMTDFAPGIEKGDAVSTHWDFIVEKIDPTVAKKMTDKKAELGKM